MNNLDSVIKFNILYINFDWKVVEHFINIMWINKKDNVNINTNKILPKFSYITNE